MKKYFPTELILQIYNLLIFLFLLLFAGKVENLFLMLAIHAFMAVTIHYLNIIKFRYENIAVNFLIILAPVLLFSWYHYECGLINRFIFPDFFDNAIQKLDVWVFGKSYHKILARSLNSEIADQLIHFFYFSYYGILFIPAFLLMLNERKKPENPTWQHFVLTRKLLFTITFTMLLCYVIFIIFPVKGPTDYHRVLFPDPKGMVKIMNFLYANGDTDGGAVPSSHVAVSFVITIFICRHFKKIRWYLLVFFIGLAIGTTYCSYHYFIDVLGGLLTGGICYFLAGKLFPKLEHKPSE